MALKSTLVIRMGAKESDLSPQISKFKNLPASENYGTNSQRSWNQDSSFPHQQHVFTKIKLKYHQLQLYWAQKKWFTVIFQFSIMHRGAGSTTTHFIIYLLHQRPTFTKSFYVSVIHILSSHLDDRMLAIIWVQKHSSARSHLTLNSLSIIKNTKIAHTIMVTIHNVII